MNAADSVDLEGIVLPDTAKPLGPMRLPRSALADWLADRLVGFYECHKCGREDYCKYRAEGCGDRKCGVLQDVVRSFVLSTFALVSCRDRGQLQKYIDAAALLVDFVHGVEWRVGYWMQRARRGDQDGYALDDLVSFAGLPQLRLTLDRYAEAVRDMEGLARKTTMILVEGKSEAEFFKKLGEHGLYARIQDADIQSYEGAGKRQKKLRLLIERERRNGYGVSLIADKDGKAEGGCDPLVRNGLLTKDYTFSFPWDFETSFPPEMVYFALRGWLRDEHPLMGACPSGRGVTWGPQGCRALPEDLTLDAFMAKMPKESEQSVVTVLEREWEFSNKVQLARELASLLIWLEGQGHSDATDRIQRAEIGQLLEKLQSLPVWNLPKEVALKAVAGPGG